MKATTRATRTVLLAAAIGLAGGCSQMDVNVRLTPTGGAEITERLVFSRTQLEQEAGLPDGARLQDLLSKDRAVKRAERMGTGCRLVRHEITRTADAGLEAVAEYAIPDINDLRYLPPMFGSAEHAASELRFEVGPSYAMRHASPDAPGWMYVEFSVRKSGGVLRDNVPADSVPEATPAELQAARELIGAAKDLLKDSRIRITFEAYDVLWYGSRQYTRKLNAPGTRSPTNKYVLIHCSGKDLDAVGRSVLDNEELMLELLRGDYAGANIRRHADWQRARSDPRAPTFYTPGLTWQNCRLRFAPSEYHYKKYFDGKLVSQGGNVTSGGEGEGTEAPEE